MTNLELIVNDIKNLRGANVEIFGQPTQLKEEIGNTYIDVLDVLEALRPYEHIMEVDEVDEEGEFVGVKEFKDIDAYLDWMKEVNNLKKEGATNTYNWSSNVSNHINYHIYVDDMDYAYLVIKVHRYGDVRCNYTNEAICRFDTIEDLYDVLDVEKSNTIEVNGEKYTYYVRLLSEEMVIEGEDYSQGYTYARGSEDEIIEAIKNGEVEFF